MRTSGGMARHPPIRGSLGKLPTPLLPVDGGGKQQHMFINLDFYEDSEDVLARFKHEDKGYEVTVITAPRDVLKEDGPVVNQTSPTDVQVIFSLEYLEEYMDIAQRNNEEEFGEGAFAIGFALILSQALIAAEEAFGEGR